MGPLGSILKIPGGLPPNPQPDGLGYNPRCLRRDISLRAASETSDSKVSALIKNHKDIESFQTVYQGEYAEGKMGVHTGGHFQIGGDSASDFFASPADPTFWAHHSMIDKVWWTWQNLDIEKRQFAIAGGTVRGMGPDGMLDVGPNGTLDDALTMGQYVGMPDITIRDAMSTLAGPFCYIYA
jgi:tyrosinase